MISVGADSLKRLTYGGQVPFCVETDAGTLICTEILRIIPGRRVVCKSMLRNEEVIAKFFVDTVRAKRHINRETAGLRALHEAGIPSPKIIAESTVNNLVTVLITEYLAGTSSPCDMLKKFPPGTEEARKILGQFFTLTAKFHKAGLAQKDLHLDNFLLKDGVLYAIDVANLTRVGRPLSASAAIDNLALFLSQFACDYHPAILGELESYNAENPQVTIDRLELLKRGAAKRRKIWRKKAKKCFKDCTDIIRKSSFRRLVLCKRHYYKGEFMDFLNNPDTFMALARLLKDGRSSTVGVVEIENDKYVVKRFNVKNAAKLVRRQFPPSRARRNWIMGHLMDFENIGTPQPVAVVEKRFGPFRGTSYIVTRFMDAPSIRQALLAAGDNRQKQEELTSLFTATLKKLHSRRITHGDLKDTNFLYAGERLCIVDLDAVKLHRLKLTLMPAIRKDISRLKQNFTRFPELVEFVDGCLPQNS